ncbi:MAG: nucleoside-diphosphate kinase, partial [Bryobacterales bacterium]|nr:nucleoside-diphosphate kinase [Bryobacterales bacterium]
TIIVGGGPGVHTLLLHPTLTIITPPGGGAANAGRIIARLEQEGFTIVAMKKLALSEAQARGFYAVHSERPFFEDLVAFMTSGPIVPMVLERESAVAALREVMGATDSLKAAEGTIRNLYGTDIERNAIHGSDGPDTAEVERAFFFSSLEQA